MTFEDFQKAGCEESYISVINLMKGRPIYCQDEEMIDKAIECFRQVDRKDLIIEINQFY